MDTTIILVRHGRTAWNREPRFRGRADVPLDDYGHRQAAAAAVAIAARYSPAAVLCSPLQRTVDTARPIAAAVGVPLRSSSALLDMSFGKLAGLTLAEAAAAYPKVYQAWHEAPDTVAFPGGETIHDVRARVASLIWRLRDQYPGGQVVLVSHDCVCRVLGCYLLGRHERDFWRLYFDTSSISEFVLRDDDVIVKRLNETTHIPAE
ncbi:MAG: histidine phosphatase family protein [Anaerolineae bacterium]